MGDIRWYTWCVTKKGETAVIVPVPGVDALRQAWVPERRDSGMPAHVTLLYPFAEDGAENPTVHAVLREEFSTVRAFEVRLARFARFPGVLYLVPEPEETFRRLTQRLMVLFPRCKPYGGAYEGITPHLTIAHNMGWERFNDIESAATAQLPHVTVVSEAWLMRYDGARWQPCSVYPFSQVPPGPDSEDT